MNVLRRSAFVTLIFLLHFEPIRSAVSVGEEENPKESRQKQRSPGEAEEDAVFAAAVLGLVHDRVRDVGDLFRVVGDTAGGLAGGSIKAVGATVNGLSSALDSVSRTVEPTSKVVDDGSSPPSASSDEFSETNDRYDPATRYDNEHAEGPTSKTHPADQGQDASGSPDPFDRVATVARTSLAGSLKLVSTAVRGVGDAVSQAGTVVEELTGGTGQVAEDVVRMVQGVVGWARDDMLRFSERDDPTEVRQDDMWPPSTPGTKATLSSKSTSSGYGEGTKSIAKKPESVMPDAGGDAYVDSWTISTLWRRGCVLALAALEVAIRELAGLFRRRNGAPPPALRLGVVFMLVLLIVGRRRRHGQHLPHDHHQQQQPLRSAETAEPSTPRQSNIAVASAPTPMGAVAAALTSPSRSLFNGSRWPSFLPARAVSGSQQPSFEGDLGTLDYLDRVLHSPAQVRAPFQARVIRSRAPVLGRHEARAGFEASGVVGAEAVMAERNESERVVTRGLWDWRRSLRWMGFCESREGGGSGRGGGGGGIGRRWIWIVLLWFAASVHEERERDRVAWLAWDEGFREGEAFRVADPSAATAESAAWLNHLIGGMWDGHPMGQHASQSNVSGRGSDTASEGVPKGLRAFVSEHVSASITEALEEFNSKPTSVVRVELQEVDLGSSPPQVLGIKVLDATTPGTPGYGDGKCTLATDCLGLQIDLEVATRGLRVGFGVKPSTRGDKAVLPSGTVRLLALYLMGRLSVRVELREEFPFVGIALIAFDGDPDVQVRVEQWGLDALTLGAVDEWAKVGLQSAFKPFLLPGYMEIDAALALCPDCPATTPAPVNESSRQQEDPEAAGPNVRSVLPLSRPSAGAAAAIATAPDDASVGRLGSWWTSSSSKTLGREASDRQGPLNKNMGWEWDPWKLGEGRSDSLSSGRNDIGISSRDMRQVPGVLSPSQAPTVASKELHEERRGVGWTLERLNDRLLSGSAKEAGGKCDQCKQHRGAME